MAKWDDRALECYVRGILKPIESTTSDNNNTGNNSNSSPQQTDKYELKCDRDFESEVYKTGGQQKTWEFLPQIKCDVTLLTGALSDTYINDDPSSRNDNDSAPHGMGMSLEKLKKQFTGVRSLRSETVANTGHFLPLERPDIITSHVIEMLERLNLLPSPQSHL
jgi:pimeloyl-ACP methyl ester carboxylesterase